MWECKTCSEENEETFDLCWKCFTPSGDRRNSTSEYLEESDSYDEDAKQFDDENLMVSVASSVSSRRSITFSLRSLFALIVVAALGFFTWGFVQGVQDEKNRLATILNEIESAKTELAETEAQVRGLPIRCCSKRFRTSTPLSNHCESKAKLISRGF